LLANLCHDCRACYQACMYAPPHEFAVNVPALLSRGRLESYRRYAWPGAFARLFDHPRHAAAGASLIVAVLVLVAIVVRAGVGGLVAVQTRPRAVYPLVRSAGGVGGDDPVGSSPHAAGGWVLPALARRRRQPPAAAGPAPLGGGAERRRETPLFEGWGRRLPLPRSVAAGPGQAGASPRTGCGVR